MAEPKDADDPIARRIAELIDEINDQMRVTSPSSLGDCILRLKLLRTPAQFHPDDCDIAFGRVITFLEGYAFVREVTCEPLPPGTSPLRILDREFRSLAGALDDHVKPPGDDEEYDVAADRIYEVFRAINVTPPTDLADCAIKLKRLVDPEHGTVAGGEVEGDDMCITQVITFIERHRWRSSDGRRRRSYGAQNVGILRPMTEDDLDTIEDMRAAIAACTPGGRDGELLKLIATATLFTDLLTVHPPDSGLIERMNRDLAAVGYELRRTARH
ncbi:MAG: hypothetical protein J2P48_17330 [Alphaproteobacteria bacterium]|nr:hypothetical protein [Alphaproteobacteria bacterium]